MDVPKGAGNVKLHEASRFQDFGMHQRKSADKNNVPVRIILVGMELARPYNAKI